LALAALVVATEATPERAADEDLASLREEEGFKALVRASAPKR
jgi:hypothetical protein